MVDQAQEIITSPAVEDQDLTISIKKLSVPAKPIAESAAPAGPRSVLLVCRDRDSLKWGPRWLTQTGFDTTVHTDPGDALDVARATKPDIIIVEARLKDRNGVRLFSAFQDAADLAAKVMVLCSNTKEVLAALDADVSDVARTPIEWQVVGRRAMKEVKYGAAMAELEQARKSQTEAIQLAENVRLRLRNRESFEPVTGLPNKTKFLDLLQRGISAAERDNNALAVFVIGFSRFRTVIDAVGQESANRVLADLGGRLNNCLQDANTLQQNVSGLRTAAVASLGSARFGLMLTCSADEAELSALQLRLANELSRPGHIAGQTVYLSSCIGVALYPQDSSSADSLLQGAESAMREAQSRGGGFGFYSADMDASAARKLKIEHMLHEAFEQRELTLAYQPLTDVASGRVLGAEALLRWQQPDESFIPPAEFVPIAEECGLMNKIGAWVLDESCRQLKCWQDAGLPPLRMSVNVSKCQLQTGEFVETVRRVLDKHDLDPAWLDLELSERGVLSGADDVLSQLHELKNLNVQLSIDDFGTGESAIAYLKELPVDVLKIDRSYISGLKRNSKDTAITSAMVALAQRLDLTVVAEGVETSEQLAILQKLGCDEYQGFHQSPAISSEAFAEFIKKAQV